MERGDRKTPVAKPLSYAASGEAAAQDQNVYDVAQLG